MIYYTNLCYFFFLKFDFMLKRKHMFKKRTLTILEKKHTNLKFGTYGLKSSKNQIFNFVYLRLFKKLFRKRFIKIKIRFFKPKYFFNIVANFIISAKSKNARMGAGAGVLIRLVQLLKKGFLVIEFRKYSLFFLVKACNFILFKSKILLTLVK